MPHDIPVEQWRHFGHALHFSSGDRCMFHLGTLIGDIVISSIGQYVQENKVTEIGPGRLFETMIFRSTGFEECGCPEIDPLNIDFMPATTVSECADNHWRMCRKYANQQCLKKALNA